MKTSLLKGGVVVVASLFLVITTVYAVTTIGTDISTGGTLGVDGNSTFGNAATDINLFTGTLQASTTALFTGAVTSYGNFTFGDAAADVNLFTGTLQASTTALFTGAATLYGNNIFGDAVTDTNVFTGTLQASTTALFTGAVTSYGNFTFGDAAADVNLFTGTLQASTTALFTGSSIFYSLATFTTVTSTSATTTDYLWVGGWATPAGGFDLKNGDIYAGSDLHVAGNATTTGRMSVGSESAAATTTLQIKAPGTSGKGSCLEMAGLDGNIYNIFINEDGFLTTTSTGSCIQ